ncbi:Sphingolipid long chain base-responsive protein LSP1 [Botrytis cinerea]
MGESTEDDAISEISDKIGVLLSELGDQEDYYAHSLDDSRGVLKAIRNTEKSVQPSRDHKHKLEEQIAKLRAKEPQSATLVTLEQELVRAEAEQLVAEAQLTNITRKKIKEAYDAEFTATIERAEKQIILARHGRRLLNLLDDTPIVPGNIRPVFEHTEQARQILNDAEDDLRDWQFDAEEVQSHVQNVEGSIVGTEDGYRNEGVQSEIGDSRISSGQQNPGSYAPSVTGTSVTTGPTETSEVNRVA